jgi:hypothetical protein
MLPLKQGSSMPKYRAYLVDKDGFFHSSIALECADDTAARAETMQLVDGHDLELWQSDRKISVFSHIDKSETFSQDDNGAAVDKPRGAPNEED